MTVLKLGTRGSPLALTQANMVKDALAAAHGVACACARDEVTFRLPALPAS